MKTALIKGQIYHVFNRSIEKRPIFITKRHYQRAITTLNFYQYTAGGSRLSYFLNWSKEDQFTYFQQKKQSERRIDILAYCLMPNHFHFLLKQNEDQGISRFISDFTNSYTRYFNTQSPSRVGPLFQGIFKSVHVEDDDQLLHVHRYIHINPSVSSIVTKEELAFYPWSSLGEYLGNPSKTICQKGIIMDFFPSVKKYREFIYDQIDYAKTLQSIKHLIFEEV